MKYNTRLIFKDNSSLIDYTTELTNFRTGTATINVVASEDALYVGSLLPFNHLYFDVATANDQTSEVTIQNWWSSNWHNTFDVIDETKLSGKTLAQSGIISWSTDNFKGWDYWGRNDSTNFGLQSLNIFDRYWVKITFSGNLKATTALKYVGHKFSNDTQLYGFYPDLNNTALKTAFASGKTNWDEQAFQAASDIEDYLNSTNVLITKDQILDSSLLEKASIHKTAEIIYFALGKDYVPHMTRARNKFKEAMNIKSFRVDLNLNANLDGLEISSNVGEFYR